MLHDPNKYSKNTFKKVKKVLFLKHVGRKELAVKRRCWVHLQDLYVKVTASLNTDFYDLKNAFLRLFIFTNYNFKRKINLT